MSNIKSTLPSEGQVMELHGMGFSNTEIAKKCGCSQSYISRIVSLNVGEPPLHKDSPKQPIKRPKAEYSNFQREEYIDKLINS
jgi:hypothetical protein